MPKHFIDTIRLHVKLYRDPKSGIAWVEDGSSGTGHSCHPNISTTGSVRHMEDKGWWHKGDRTVKAYDGFAGFWAPQAPKRPRPPKRCAGA